jgi:predicted protein tyrosine phosphatase
MTDANRRRLILLASARARAIEATILATHLVEDLVEVKLDGAPTQRVREIVDTLLELRGRIEHEIGEVPR